MAVFLDTIFLFSRDTVAAARARRVLVLRILLDAVLVRVLVSLPHRAISIITDDADSV